MIPSKASSPTVSTVDVEHHAPPPSSPPHRSSSKRTVTALVAEHDALAASRSPFSRQRYSGALLFNLLAFLLPALYGTLVKLWVADIDASLVATTDAYTYMTVVVEVLNEGLPRAAWSTIGDNHNRSLPARHGLAYTLILFQALLGALLSVIFVALAPNFASSFIPGRARAVSVQYVRIAAFTALASTVETSVASATRALDKPDVPLLTSCVKFAVNIALDMALVSRWHVRGVTPSVALQATTQLACSLVAAGAGLGYFLWTTGRERVAAPARLDDFARPTVGGLKVLARPGVYTLAETGVRNALYLWLVSGIVGMGVDHATAWGVFNTIRWGLVMVPVQALEATTLAFTGHAWGLWRRSIGVNVRRPRAAWRQLLRIARPAGLSVVLALAFEVPICLFLSFYGASRFARYLSASEAVAGIVETMWRTIDWCYIFYAVSTQLAAVLLASRPDWYLYQSLASNILWVLPWAVVVTRIGITPDTAWKYHSIVFGGSLVFSFIVILLVLVIMALCLTRGRMRLPIVHGARTDS